jgi:class 3 adenylate cyclase
MAESASQTVVCSVLYLDIVEYSQRIVTEQIRLKEQFIAALTEAIAGVAATDRIIRDTGGGAVLSFLGNPEDALLVCVGVCNALAGPQMSAGSKAWIRAGINLGPVGLVKDMNGQPSVIGDGVKVAQYIMIFAEPGQILVSRPYYDVMVRLSESYAKLFSYQGERTDHNVRAHRVYAVSAEAGSLLRRQVAKTTAPESTTAFVAWMKYLVAFGVVAMAVNWPAIDAWVRNLLLR